MDKQRAIEIVRQFATSSYCTYDTKKAKRYHTFTEENLLKAVAAILLEAAEVCDKITDEHREKYGQYGPQSGDACSFALEEMAEGLT